MRLIDADSVIAVCERCSAIEWNKKVAPASWAYAYESFAEEIDSQPTAYDVEAVVRGLEKLHIRNTKGVLVAEVYNNAINDAIKVVKRGGRNE